MSYLANTSEAEVISHTKPISLGGKYTLSAYAFRQEKLKFLGHKGSHRIQPISHPLFFKRASCLINRLSK